ncbi:hypothetical protein ACK378_16765 [Aeromonas veronii]
MICNKIYERLLADFPGQYKSLTDISYNDASEKKFYCSDVKFISFDDIEFTPGKGDKKGKAPDMLACAGGKFIFVEFKEGACKNVKDDDVKLKIIEGINSLYRYSASKLSIARQDFLNIDIDYFVFHRKPPQKGSIFQHMQRSIVRWRLSEYKGLYLREVATLDEHEEAFKVLNKISNGSLLSGTYVSYLGHETIVEEWAAV